MQKRTYVWTRAGSVTGSTRKPDPSSPGTSVLLDNFPFAIMMTRPDRTIVAWNREAARLTGLAPETVVGADCARVFGCSLRGGECSDTCGLRRAIASRASPQGAPEEERRTMAVRAPTGLIPVQPYPVCLTFEAQPVVEKTVVETAEEPLAMLVMRDLRPELELSDGAETMPGKTSAQLSQAHRLQEKLFHLPAARISWRKRTLSLASFNAPSMEVGGDFLRVMACKSGVVFAIVGDVLGKGVAAGLVASMAFALFGDAVKAGLSPQAILRELNETLCEAVGPNMFVTAIVARFDLKAARCTLARAGHEPALLGRDGRCTSLPRQPNLPLGVFRRVRYSATTVALRKGDRLVFYTDGLVEIDTSPAARIRTGVFSGGPRVTMTREALGQMVRETHASTAAQLQTQILESLPDDCLPARDDVSLLVAVVE